jgi:hypothetical protein
MSYSPVSAAFEGFHLVVRRPAAFLVWWAVIGLTLAVLAALDVAEPKLGAGWRGANGGLIGGVAAVALMFVAKTLVACAVYRAVAKPGPRAFADLGVGAGELRVLVISALLTLAALACAAGAGFGLLFAARQPLWLLGLDGSRLAPAVRAAGVAVGLLLFVPLAFLGVRTSLAPAVALLEGRRSFARAWSLSRGRFWSLFGLWTVVAIVDLLLELVGQLSLEATGYAPMMSRFGVHLPRLFESGPVQLVAFYGLAALMQTVITVLWAAPSAAVYRELGQRRRAPVEVFE